MCLPKFGEKSMGDEDLGNTLAVRAAVIKKEI